MPFNVIYFETPSYWSGEPDIRREKTFGSIEEAAQFVAEFSKSTKYSFESIVEVPSPEEQVKTSQKFLNLLDALSEKRLDKENHLK